MKICHLSFARVNRTKPEAWLRRIDFFVRLLEVMAKKVEVHSVYPIGSAASREVNRVWHHFVPNGLAHQCYPWRTFRLVRALQPDIVIIHGLRFPWQLVLTRRAASWARLFVQHHGEAPGKWIPPWAYRAANKHVEAFFFTSQTQALPWLQSKSLPQHAVVHEMMEVPSVFEEYASNNHTGRQPLHFLWIGRLNANKDPLTLVRGFKHFITQSSGATLDIIYSSEELMDEVRKETGKEASIRLIPGMDHMSLLPHLQKASFIISTSHTEGSGIAVAEAMSLGCIPVLTRIPSFQFMTGDGRVGLFFTPGDAASLATTLSHAINLDREEWRIKVQQQYESHLSATAISSKILSVIDQVPTP
ncbi:MAG: glycosyltransferase [Cyclobacteriaceae bacterium]